MTIRWKLNLSVAALILMFLVAGAFAMRAVSLNAEYSRQYVRTRDPSQFAADLATELHRRLAALAGMVQLPDEPERTPWPKFALDDLDVQVRLARDDEERALWQQVADAIAVIGQARADSPPDQAILASAERSLQALRRRYDLAQYDAAVTMANTGLTAQKAIWVSCAVTVLLFLIYLIMVRRWLVTPIEAIKSAADAIGRGQLGHRVPLSGTDELAQLARHIDAMATNLERHQAALLEARELTAVGELCANVAHGLRNPLAALRAGAQLAERRADGSDPLRKIVHDLVLQTDRMDTRISRLFTFSRPCELRREPTRFADLAAAVQAEVMSLLQTQSNRLTIDDQTGEAAWAVDRSQLVDALCELVANAHHHSPSGSEITLRAQPVAGDGAPHLRIDVIDHGTGMQPATSAKAFELFFTSRSEGTGMGLALVRRIVTKHGGQIDIESALGSGTTVTLRLPASQASSTPSG